MAVISVMTQTALLNSLAPNTQPLPPSWWPPAPGYWLVLSTVSVLVLALIVSRLRHRHRHRALHRLSVIKNTGSDPNRELHELLRWLAIRHQAMKPGLAPKAFADFIAKTTGKPAPVWLNSHYNPEWEPCIEWEEAEALVRSLTRRQTA